MSALTRCNRCALDALERQYGKERVRLVPDDGWLSVEVLQPGGWTWAGESFLELSDGCVC